MYALPNKTQHKLIVKVRGGISQKLDNLTSSSTTSSASSISGGSLLSPLTTASSALSRQIDDNGFNAELSHLPQPVFHSISLNGNGKPKSSSHQNRIAKQYITPEHNEMIKYVQQSWKGVERDYKKSVNNYINNIDLTSSTEHPSSSHLKQKQVNAKKKTATLSTPLLLSGSYHHTSGTKDSSNNRQDTFQPFDLEAFWGNRILKRLTE